MTSYRASAAAMVVCSALVSYLGCWSAPVWCWEDFYLLTQGRPRQYRRRYNPLCQYQQDIERLSLEPYTKFKPSKPRMIVLSSRVDQPPVSGVPVAGAKAGSRVSMSILR